MRCSKKSELCDLRILKMLTFRDGVSFGEALGKILINLKRNDDILNTLKNCGAQCVSLHSAALGHFPYCPYPRAVPADIKYSIRAIIILLMLRDLKWRIFWQINATTITDERKIVQSQLLKCIYIINSIHLHDRQYVSK